MIVWLPSPPLFAQARMRFVTSHPRYMSERVIDAVAETPALCEMFHIPFQASFS